MPFECRLAILENAAYVHHMVAVLIGGGFEDIGFVEVEKIPSRSGDFFFVLLYQGGVERREVLQRHQRIGLDEFAVAVDNLGVFVPCCDFKFGREYYNLTAVAHTDTEFLDHAFGECDR